VTALADAAGEYVRLRRALGFKLVAQDRQISESPLSRSGRERTE
jgi:hypothetical protein